MGAATVGPTRHPRWGRISGLGVATIVAYGVAYYSYGALIDPIRQATGWSATALGATFSAILVIGGVGGLIGGRLADRFGTRPVFLLAGTLGATGIAVGSISTGPLAFGAAYGTGAGVVSALGYYHITQPAAVRAGDGQPQRAIVVLTVFGAFASPIFLPLTAWLAHHIGWRDTLRVHALLVAAIFLPCASWRNSSASIGGGDLSTPGDAGQVRQILGSAWSKPAVRRWVLASMISGAAIDIILLYQIPIMVAAGLPTATAASIAGIRGLAQVGGRFTLPPLLRRIGARLTTVAALAMALTAVVLLLGSRHVTWAVGYCLLAGASLGAISTLQGIYTHELVGNKDLSMLMGAQQAVFAVGSALGPLIAAALLQQAHSYKPVIALAAVGVLTAALLLATERPAKVGSSRWGSSQKTTL